GLLQHLLCFFESFMPLPGWFKRRVFAGDIKKNVSTKSVRLQRILILGFARILLVSGKRRFRRHGVPEHPVADTAPDVAEIFVASRLRSLPACSLYKVVRGVVEKSILIADDFL